MKTRKRLAELPDASLESLTPREREVLILAHESFSDKSIAEKLGVAPGTVKIHMRSARVKHEALNAARTELQNSQNKPS